MESGVASIDSEWIFMIRVFCISNGFIQIKSVQTTTSKKMSKCQLFM